MLSQDQLGRLIQGENAFAAVYQRLQASLERVWQQLDALPALLRPIDWLRSWSRRPEGPAAAEEAQGPAAWPGA